MLPFADDLRPLENAAADNCELLNVACAGGRYQQCTYCTKDLQCVSTVWTQIYRVTHILL